MSTKTYSKDNYTVSLKAYKAWVTLTIGDRESTDIPHEEAELRQQVYGELGFDMVEEFHQLNFYHVQLIGRTTYPERSEYIVVAESEDACFEQLGTYTRSSWAHADITYLSASVPSAKPCVFVNNSSKPYLTAS